MDVGLDVQQILLHVALDSIFPEPVIPEPQPAQSVTLPTLFPSRSVTGSTANFCRINFQ